MKNVIFYYLYFIVGYTSLAQLGVNNDNTTPHPSAQLDIKSSNRGLLLPRITSPASAIASPTAGLIVYDQANANLAYHNGAQWSNLTGTTGNQGLYARFPNSVGFKGEYFNASPSYTEYTWTVPAGITKIWVEAWAAGSAGFSIQPTTTTNATSIGFRGGNAGDFGSFLMNVSSGELITVRVGKGGNSVNNIGGSTMIISSIAPVKSYTIWQKLPNLTLTIGGVATNEIPDLIQYVAGESGHLTKISYEQSSATQFRRVVSGGKGGDSYPAQKGSGEGLTISFDAATGEHLMGGLISIGSRDGSSPGAGGGVSFGSTNNGGVGMVILHW
jgi:hypothetical protein